jgi:DNA polymerase-3 subunit epsilon
MTAANLLQLDSEELATTLEADNRYRVLRRLSPRIAAQFPPIEEPLKLGLYIDCETTGKDPLTCNITELAIVPFSFTADGVIHFIHAGLSWLNDPGEPIPAEVIAITGITDEMVAGKSIDWPCVMDFYDAADLCVAHHASFDRKVFERALLTQYSDGNDTKPWACSYKDIDWRGLFDAPCAKLGHLLMDVCRTFHDGHRAVDDCHAGIHLLAAASIADRTAFSYLLESTRTLTVRFYADHAPFGVKDALKARGYTWAPDYWPQNARKPGAWYRDVKPSEDPAERAWLHDSAFCTQPFVRRFGARDRYSTRV